eukprot:482697-Amphidinium_carterae.1
MTQQTTSVGCTSSSAEQAMRLAYDEVIVSETIALLGTKRASREDGKVMHGIRTNCTQGGNGED